jgi:hypothetical protein
MGNINGSIEQDAPFNEHFFGLVNVSFILFHSIYMINLI